MPARPPADKVPPQPSESAYPDRDDDRILDLCDHCPDQAEIYNGYQDTDGCPETVVVHDAEDLVLQPVFFATGSAALRSEQLEVVSVQADYFRRHAEVERIVCVGRATTDERNADMLALARAEALCAAYEQQGIDATRLLTRSMGTYALAGERGDPEARRQAVTRLELVSGMRVARWNGRYLEELARPERIRAEPPPPRRPEYPGCPGAAEDPR